MKRKSMKIKLIYRAVILCTALCLLFGALFPAHAAETALPGETADVPQTEPAPQIQTGWVRQGGASLYYLPDGTLAVGKVKIQDKTYYFSKRGVMQTGWKRIDGKKYYFNEKGVMQTGWKKIDDKKYYFSERGVMRTGWKRIDGDRYYFNEKGVMQTGWQTIGKSKYYFGKKGAAQTGWLTLDGKTYYFDKDGKMAKGWLTLKKKRYYLDEEGVLQTGRQIIDGYVYYLNEKTGEEDTKRTAKLSDLEKLCIQIVNSRVNEKDSVNTKLSKLFQYVTWNHSYVRSYGFSAYSGWHKAYAYRMLKNKGGNCYSYAAAFAYLEKKATDLPVRVGWGSTPAIGGGLTPHGWCEIQIKGTWYVFDPDLYRYVYPGSCYYQTMGSVGGYYYGRHYATVEF